MRKRMWIAFVGIVVAAGCNGTSAPSASLGQPIATPAPRSTAPSAITGQPPDDVDVCALMPLGDVQARSPFTRPLVTAKSDPDSCRYTSATTDIGTSIQLVVEGFPRPSDTLDALHAQGQSYADLGSPPQAITGLGDAAIGIPRPEEAGVWAAVGSRLIRAILKGEWQAGDVPDVPLATKFAAGTELLRLVIARLP